MAQDNNKKVTDRDTIISLTQSAISFENQGEYDKALEYYKKALAFNETLFGKDHPTLSIDYANIGDFYVRIEKFEKALKYYQKALSLIENNSNNQKLAYIYSDIGNVLSSLGDNEKALTYFQKSFEIREKVFGASHPLTGATCNELAWTYCLKEQYKEALPWAEKCVSILPFSPNCADTLATVYQGLGWFEKALEQFEQSLKLKKEPMDTKESIQNTKTKIAKLKEIMKEFE